MAKPTQSNSEFNKMLNRKIAQLQKELVRRLEYIGMVCIEEARLSNQYTDRSGNLRSSVGYAVLKNGKKIKSGGFEEVKEGKEGVKEGKKFLNEVSKNFTQGFVLVVVAGMNYASYVEALGRDVISGSEIKAREVAKKMLEDLDKKFN